MLKLKILTGAMLVAMPLLVYADTDCSNAVKLNPDHTYKKGERVWTQDPSGNYHIYSCDKDSCQGPSDRGGWKSVGTRVATSGAGSCK
jgi:hypothetical protein